MKYSVFADHDGPRPGKFSHEGNWECIADRVTLADARRIALEAVDVRGFARASIFEAKNAGQLVDPESGAPS